MINENLPLINLAISLAGSWFSCLADAGLKTFIAAKRKVTIIFRNNQAETE